MKRFLTILPIPLAVLMLLGGCGAAGEKSESMAVIYGVTAVLSFVLLVGYCCMEPKKDPWFLLLFSSVLVVNIGYLTLAISRSLDEALLANRLAYLGSVFLPLAMWMIILRVTKTQYKPWLPWILVGVGVMVFLVAASPGYLDIYYKEVYFEKVGGVTVLTKVYGPWHHLYLVYLLGYFTMTSVIVIRVAAEKKMESAAYTVILATAVFVNMGVWLIEQLVRLDFEFLSMSYIISEAFLLGLHLVMRTHARQQVPAVPVAEETPVQLQAVPVEESPGDPACRLDSECITLFLSGMRELTPTERTIFECYTAGRSSKEVMAQLNIKENTLKFHNRNIYSKLGVSSRKQLLEIHRQLPEE